MDDLTDLRRTIRRLIEEYAKEEPSVGDIEVETIFDEAKDHYELMYSGWDGHRRVHGSVLHLDIRGGKVWIQHDGTYDGIANSLVEAGVPRDRIVLAFKPPDVRKFTDFAVS
jgi:hypothetical protein